MSRSVHQTRRDLKDVRRWKFGARAALDVEVWLVEDRLAAKRRYKRRASRHRRLAVSTDGPGAVEAVTEPMAEHLHHPLGEDDIRALLGLLPANVRPGLRAVRRRTGFARGGHDRRGHRARPADRPPRVRAGGRHLGATPPRSLPAECRGPSRPSASRQTTSTRTRIAWMRWWGPSAGAMRWRPPAARSHGDAGGRRRCPLRLERTRCHIELGDFSGADVDLDVVAGSGRRLATAARALRADSLPRRERWQAARAEATDALNAGPPLWPSALLMAVAWEAAARLGEAGAAPVPTEAHVRTLRLHGRAAWVDRMVELGERGAAFDPACAAIRPDRPRVGRQRALTGVRRPPPSWEDGPVTSSAAAGRSSPGCCCSPPVRSPAAWPRRRRG